MAISYHKGDVCSHSKIISPGRASRGSAAVYLLHVPSFFVCIEILEMRDLLATQAGTLVMNHCFFSDESREMSWLVGLFLTFTPGSSADMVALAGS